MLGTFGPVGFMGLHVLASANSHPALPSVERRTGYPEIDLQVSCLFAKTGKLAGSQKFQPGCEIISPP